MYSFAPHAATELREMATDILDDPEAVEGLMKALEEKGALADDPLPEPEPEPEPMTPKERPWALIVGVNVLLLAFVACMIVRRSRRTRHGVRNRG